MGKPRRYELPEAVRGSLGSFGKSLAAGWVHAAQLAELLATLDTLPPEAVAVVAHYVPLVGQLWPDAYYRASQRSRWFAWLRRPSDSDLLFRNPNLKYLFLFHGSGRLREASLRLIVETARSSFWVAALAYRLNDWVPQVRTAALECARRILPWTDGPTLIPALLYLLQASSDWQRGRHEIEVIDDTIARPDIASVLAERFRTATTGPMGRVLLRCLKRPALDFYLPQLAREAQLPHVRCVATMTLLAGMASWREGLRMAWLDRPFNKHTYVPNILTRNLETVPSRDSVVMQAARDRSPMVRKIAAQAAVDYRASLGNMDEIVALLANDSNRGIRERIAFVLKERNRPVA